MHQNRLNEVELGGGNVESVNIGGEAGEGLLRAVGADEGVDLDARDVVLLLEGSGDLALVGLNVDDEDEGVVLLDLDSGQRLLLSLLRLFELPSS